jgi:DNA-binding NtrC family response regulator
MKPRRVLVIDDEQVICDACQLILSEQGCRVEHELTGTAGLLAIEKSDFDVVLLDLKLPDMDGMEVLRRVGKEKPGLSVIVMTGFSTTLIAVEAMKNGATDYLGKPFTDDELITTVENANVNSAERM